jgi:hypothetical protein
MTALKVPEDMEDSHLRLFGKEAWCARRTLHFKVNCRQSLA